MSDSKRRHGAEACGAGDLGKIAGVITIGACPCCAADIGVAVTENPISKQRERALVHEMPFCDYFGETDAEQIEREIVERRGL